MSHLGFLLLYLLRGMVWACVGFLVFFLGYFVWLKTSTFGDVMSWPASDYKVLGFITLVTLGAGWVALAMGRELAKYKTDP